MRFEDLAGTPNKQFPLIFTPTLERSLPLSTFFHGEGFQTVFREKIFPIFSEGCPLLYRRDPTRYDRIPVVYATSVIKVASKQSEQSLRGIAPRP
jgi:hypothetical protein